jgi:hypothetical protein
MKKYFLCVWLATVIFARVYGQEVKKNLDLIIVIDDKIADGSIASPKIQLVSGSGKEIIYVNYYPGNLSLAESDYSKILSDSTGIINLDFTYSEYVGQNQITYSYEIELKREWLEDYFNILRIYNLNKEKYKGYSASGVGKHYAYDLESPSHSRLSIKTKN